MEETETVGQGHYVAACVGVCGDGDDVTALLGAMSAESGELLPWVRQLETTSGAPRLRRHYESGTPWMGFVVAASSGVSDSRGGEGELEYDAVTVEGLASWLARVHGGALDRARAQWERLRQAGARRGVHVPDGVLFLAFDYD